MRKADPNLVELVRQLKHGGARNRDVAEASGLNMTKVGGICHRHNIKRPEVIVEDADDTDDVVVTTPIIEYRLDGGPRKATGGRLVLDLPVGQRIAKALQDEARRRNLPVERFIRELLKKIVKPDDTRPNWTLFSAILDDDK